MRLLSRAILGLVPLLSFLGLAGTAPIAAGCGEDDACTDYSPPASFDAQNPPVSFSAGVFPIFKNTCALPSCHGSTTGNPNGVFLGGDSPAKVHAAIVDVRSSRIPSMSYVKAGDPRESFLMRKMDGSSCLLDGQCTGGDCGDSMPRGEDRLGEDERNVVRRWISQGAKND